MNFISQKIILGNPGNLRLRTKAILIYCCCLAVFFPCFLVGGAVAGLNERPKFFNSFTVEEEFGFNMLVNTRPVMVPMFFSNKNKCQCTRKCFFEFGTSDSLDSFTFGDNRKPVCRDNSDKGPSNGKPTSDDCEPVGIYFDGSLLEFFGWLLLGFVVGILISLFPVYLFFKYKLRLCKMQLSEENAGC